MMNLPYELTEFLTTLRVLNPKDIMLLAKLMKVRRVKAGEILVRAGDNSKDLFVILRGLTRNYTEMVNGDERTMRFAMDGMITATPSSFADDRLAPETIIALEDGLIALVNRTELESLGKERPNIQIVYIEQIKKGLLEAHEHISFHINLTPEERYRYLRENHPKLLERVQVRHLASYIGVTPVSLSRIRTRVNGHSIS